MSTTVTRDIKITKLYKEMLGEVDDITDTPSLEELIEMVPGKIESPMIMLSAEVTNGVYRGKGYTDYKELWLDFLMRKKHQKTWQKGRWVNI